MTWFGITPENMALRRGRFSLPIDLDADGWRRYRAIMRNCMVYGATPSTTIARVTNYWAFSPLFPEVPAADPTPFYEWECVADDEDFPDLLHAQIKQGGN